jgi:predicted small metal-binding protein
MFVASNLGNNLKKLMANEANEVEKELKNHIQEVFEKLTSIMVESVKAPIQKAASSVDWDKTI